MLELLTVLSLCNILEPNFESSHQHRYLATLSQFRYLITVLHDLLGIWIPLPLRTLDDMASTCDPGL